MTRISLKEQYDNSSVIKQIADLTDQIDGYDEEIEQAVATANEASSASSAAKSTADAAATKNVEQDSRLDAIEAKDSEQDKKIETNNSTLTNRIDGIESDLTATEAVVATNQSGLATAQGDIVGLKGRTSTNESDIASQAAKNTAQDSSISALQSLTNNITSHLISNVAVKDGTANGSIMVELTDEGGSKITSPNYPWGRPNTFQLVQGSESGYLRGKLILSDGTEITSNDFQILQIIESDVYVTSITLTPYPTTGQLGGSIGYSNGNTAQINAIDVPTAPGVTSNINDLLSRMGVVESGLSDAQSNITALTSRMSSAEAKNTAQDSSISALQAKDSTIDGQISSLDSRVTAIEETPGIGQFTNTSRGTILGSTEDGKVSANSDGTGSVSGWSKVATAQSTAEAASTAAALAQSTADDANNKANTAFDDVALNSTGDGLVFTRINDTTKEIALSSGSEIHGALMTDEIVVTATEHTFSTNKIVATFTYWRSANLNVGVAATSSGESLGIFFLAPQMNSITILNSGKYWNVVVTTTVLDSAIHQSLQDLNLPDGKYDIAFKADETTDAVMCDVRVNYEVSDGNLTLTDTASTKNFDVYYNKPTTTKFFVTGIAKQLY